ncbi:TRAP transporter permease [Halomonas dongshanensis]|uniref:TRAP transporter fused permease subunit n=1 Tax=Halomonas dongshanensis TaxID=2890835 RepID=A0ABT2ECL2_9GAMM|nr:TRAP transporter fused permease subunit [Halomonas dongshanensis]MCS2609234.1 TRAP transporter fused permease subunit [Halomonas dongshanensis]
MKTSLQQETVFAHIQSGLQKLALGIALIAALYHLQLVINGIPEAYRFRTTHLSLLLPLAFLIKPSASQNRPWLLSWDLLMILTSAGTTLYLSYYDYATIIERLPGIDTLTLPQVVIGSALLLCILEAARRIVGWGMVAICLAAVAYTLFGGLISGPFAYSGSTYTDLVDKLIYTTDGIFSIPIAASATFIFLFVLFGKFLERSGAGGLFIDLAFALAGRSRGGPAKMAVITSAFMGSISGSATANVVSTGAYTIPLMKKAGYSPSLSAAVESASSTGGQLLPPVMGAAAFLLVDFVGIPYTDLIMTAAIPALLFFVGIFAAVHFESVKLGMKGVDKSLIPAWRSIFLRIYLLLPLVIVVAVMFMGYTPYLSAVLALISVIVFSAFRASTRMSFRKILMTLIDGTKDAVLICVTCAAAGIIIGVAAETGLGIKFTSVVLGSTSNSLLLLLFFMMIASLVLGMGLPTSAAYILIVAIAAPSLIDAGLEPIAAHMFILYFGVFSAITPPVAISSYAAAGLSGASPMKTSLLAFKLCIPVFLVPYLFVYHNELLLLGSPQSIAYQILSCLLGMIVFAAGISGCLHKPLSWLHSGFLVGASLFLMYTNNLLAIVATVAVIALMMKFTTKNLPKLKGSKNENSAY